MANTTVARLEQEDLRKHRAHKMIELRITNHSLPMIAEQFGLSTATVQREIQWYIKNGYLADAESEIISLTGEALRVYKSKLKLNDLDAAKHILDIAIKLGDRFQKQGHQEAELGLRAYMAAKREKDGDKAASEKTVEGVVVSVDQPEYPRATAQIAETAGVSVESIAPAAPVAATPKRAFEPRVREIEAGSREGDGLSPSTPDPIVDLTEETEDEE